ncbi:MAG TPA: hypothetical protein VGF73_04025 [Chthoniobacterales bacterium]|jgi:hypothetical protein
MLIVTVIAPAGKFVRQKQHYDRRESDRLTILRASRHGGPQHPFMNFTKNIGMLLLAIYLIVVGIVGLTGLGAGFLLPILAIIAGIFILIGK